MSHKRAAFELAIAQVMDELHDTSGKTRAELAKALKMPELEVTRIEHGAEALSAGGLMILLALYNLSWEDFTAKVNAALPRAEETIARASHHHQRPE